jgi:hypothetical protein
MYRDAMDQLTRADISAAAAVHRELGPDYSDAVAESLVERIGAEIDKRVDERLGQQPQQRGRRSPRPHPEVAPAPPASAVSAASARPAWSVVVLGLGSMGLAIGATGAVLNLTQAPGGTGGSAVFLVMVIWLVIGVINVAYARRR